MAAYAPPLTLPLFHFVFLKSSRRRRVGGPQDATQHLEVAEGLVLLGGETGATFCRVGVRKPQNPEAVSWQHDLWLLCVEDRAGRGAGLDLKTTKHSAFTVKSREETTQRCFCSICRRTDQPQTQITRDEYR